VLTGGGAIGAVAFDFGGVLTHTAFGGLALILGGVALGTGVFTPGRIRRRLASEA